MGEGAAVLFRRGLKRAYSTATPGRTVCSCFDSSSLRAMPSPRAPTQA